MKRITTLEAIRKVHDEAIFAYVPKPNANKNVAILHKIPLELIKKSYTATNAPDRLLIKAGQSFDYCYGFKYFGSENKKVKQYRYLSSHYTSCLQSVLQDHKELLVFDDEVELLEFILKIKKDKVVPTKDNSQSLLALGSYDPDTGKELPELPGSHKPHFAFLRRILAFKLK